MIRQVYLITKNRVIVRAHMEKSDCLADIPSADELEAYATEAFAERFPEVDTSQWDMSCKLRTAPQRYPGTWGVVELALTA